MIETQPKQDSSYPEFPFSHYWTQLLCHRLPPPFDTAFADFFSDFHMSLLQHCSAEEIDKMFAQAFIERAKYMEEDSVNTENAVYTSNCN